MENFLNLIQPIWKFILEVSIIIILILLIVALLGCLLDTILTIYHYGYSRLWFVRLYRELKIIRIAKQGDVNRLVFYSMKWSDSYFTVSFTIQDALYKTKNLSTALTLSKVLKEYLFTIKSINTSTYYRNASYIWASVENSLKLCKNEKVKEINQQLLALLEDNIKPDFERQENK